jgi:ATP-dependent Clp protease protease subunit
MTKNLHRLSADATTLEILFYGSISSWSDLSSQSIARILAANPAVKTIKLRVNCLGGSVFEGFAIHNLLKRHPAIKECDVDGCAASAATWVVLACSKRRMGTGALFMIHEASGDTWGPASEHEATARLLRKMNEQQIDLYTQSSKLTREDVADKVEAETWFTAAEALEAGFATEVTADVKPKARAQVADDLDALGFKNAPAAELDRFFKFAAGPRPTRARIEEEPDALEDEQTERAPAPAQLALIPDPAPPSSGSEPHKDTDMNKNLLALALGIAATLPDDQFEAAIVALADKLKAEQAKSKASSDALARFEEVTGKTGDEALSVTKSWKATVARVPELETENAQLKADGKQRDLDKLISDGTAAFKLTPALEAKIREQVAAGDMTLKGAQAFVETLPVITALANAKKDIQPPPARGSNPESSATTHNGKRFGVMTPAEREALKKSDRATYDAMRSEWIDAGRPNN